MHHHKPALLAMDLEGVLTPEIWIAVAEHTGVEELRLTTRDVADYHRLMQMRLALLREHGIGLAQIQEIIAQMEPLPGAEAFLAWVRRRWPLVIVSDTFYQFAMPLMAKLGHPTLFCHTLEVDAQGWIVDYHLRIPHPKRRTVGAFRDLGFFTVAMGDSHNDVAMLAAADVGILFRPAPQVAASHPQLPVVHTYTQAQQLLQQILPCPDTP